MVQVEHILPTKFEALISNPSTTKKKTKVSVKSPEELCIKLVNILVSGTIPVRK
jgi:hypothetical protein